MALVRSLPDPRNLLTRRDWGLMLALSSVLGCLLTQAGCDREPMIRVYEVPRIANESKNPSTVASTSAGMSPMMPGAAMRGMSKPPSGQPNRFLIAVVPNRNFVIFAKASAAPDNLENYSKPLEEFAKSIRFDGDAEKPSWSLPEGWTETPATDGIAMAKLQAKLPADSENSASSAEPVVFTVSRLPKPEDKDAWPAYFEQNVNRWRTQLGLAPSSLSDMQSVIKELAREENELPAYVIDLRSESKSENVNGETTANAQVTGAVSGKMPSEMAPPDASVPKTDSSLKYAVPDGWVDQGARGMRAASFSFEGKRDADSETAKGEVTIIFAGGDRLSNVVRWQGQLSPEMSPDEQKAAAEKAIAQANELKTAKGETGQLFTLYGSEDPAAPAMLAAIIPMENGTSSAFVKLTAPRWLADEHQSRLVGFIQSLAW